MFIKLMNRNVLVVFLKVLINWYDNVLSLSNTEKERETENETDRQTDRQGTETCTRRRQDKLNGVT